MQDGFVRVDEDLAPVAGNDDFDVDPLIDSWRYSDRKGILVATNKPGEVCRGRKIFMTGRGRIL